MTKLLVVTDGAKAWLDLTVDELSLELANASLMPSKSRFKSQDEVLRHLAYTAYARGHADARNALMSEPQAPPERARARPTPFEKAEQQVLADPDPAGQPEPS